MAETKVFERTTGAIHYEIHEVAGFAGHTEIAIMIENTPVSIIAIDKSRSGLHVKTIESKKIFIAADGKTAGPDETPPPSSAPSLSDITPKH